MGKCLGVLLGELFGLIFCRWECPRRMSGSSCRITGLCAAVMVWATGVNS